MSKVDEILELIDKALEPRWLMTKRGSVAHVDEGHGFALCRIGRLYRDTEETATGVRRCARCLARLETL